MRSDKKLIMLAAFTLLLLPMFSTVTYSGSFLTQGPRVKIKDGASSNWAGYAALTNLANPQNGAVSDVKGSWIVPAVNCSVTPSAYSSFWIGIDGYSSNTVEQTGTDSDCSSGSPRYYAWYEMYPKFPVNLKIKISPGDTITAEVQYTGNSNFQLTIKDVTTGVSFSTTQKLNNARRSSAEWIAEAPSSFSGVLPLAKFGTVNFQSAQATLNGHSGSISDSAWQNDPITMLTSSGIVKAQPSALSADGSSFSVIWNHQ